MRHFGSKTGRQNSAGEDGPATFATAPDPDQAREAGAGEHGQEEEDDDDYMNMTFDDAPAPQAETSLQRSQRLKKEGLRRGMVPSKAELAARERQRREEGLSRSLIEAAAAADKTTGRKSKGLAMMARMGFTPGSALGGREPLRIEAKEDRAGIGAGADRKRKLAEAAGAAGAAKRARAEDLGGYRERMARERGAARKEKLVAAAQKTAEQMDEEGGGDARAAAARPLRSVPVIYRGLVRQREEAERDRRARYDLEHGSGGLSAGLPAYDDEGMDGDDRIALGGRTEKKTVYMPADDLDDEDPELDEFNALEVDQRLLKLVAHLREEHRYCFWCKFAYPDDEMEGCPGLTEEDHD